MFDALIHTKYRVPALRRGLVSRKRLLEQLDMGLENRLTLVSAPAGYGKTTLLCEWVVNHRPDVKFAWLTLEESDNDPTIYLQYLITALQVVDADIGRSILPALTVPNPPALTEILSPLLNQIGQREGKIALILDDYHLITEQSVHQVTHQLIEHCFTGLQVVLATRADPPLPIYRYRAQGELTELRQAQLCFTLEETQEFLMQFGGGVFKPTEIDFLHQRTEGWVVGLLLAGLSLQESDQISGAISALSGSQLYIMEYLTNEVLNRQTERIQSFLLKTSILKRLTGPLCDQLTGFEDGFATLDYLARKNLFVSALDNEQSWYRYHQLFADLLRRRLARESKVELSQLHKAASDWYAQNGFLSDAIDHAISSEDFTYAVLLIEKHADKIWSRGEHSILIKQLQNIPLEIIHSSVPVGLLYSVLLLFRDQHKQAKELLQHAEGVIRGNASLSNLYLEKVLGTHSLHEAYLALLNLDLDQVVRHAQLALEHLPKDWQVFRQTAQMLLADAANWRGDVSSAGRVYSELLAANSLRQNPYLFFTISIRNTLLNQSRGKLHEVYDFCLQSLHWLGEMKPRLPAIERIFQIILTEILLEWNHLDEVGNRLDSALEQFKSVERSSWDILYLSTVRGYFAFGKLAPARHILELLEDGIRSSQLPRPYLNRVLVWKARMYLLQGNISQAEEALAESGKPDYEKLAAQDEDVFLATIRVWLAQGKFQQATELLDVLQTNLQQGGRNTLLIEALILRAVGEAMLKHAHPARDYLVRALSLAEPEGFVRVFIEGGPIILDLLKEMVSTGNDSAYVSQLIAAFEGASAKAGVTGTQANLAESFSKREQQVLRFLMTYLSQQEMADELCVSVNTVRFHLKNIYRKLGVHDRSEAVEKAKIAGLL